MAKKKIKTMMPKENKSPKLPSIPRKVANNTANAILKRGFVIKG